MLEVIITSLKYLGYFGIFVVSLMSASTIFLPVPLYLIIIGSSAYGLNPFLVALFSALGMSFGELTSYFIGLGGNKLLEEKHKKGLTKFNKFFNKYGFLAITVTAFLPFPFDIVGIMAGIGRYNIKKFLIATFIGKFSKALILSILGYELRLLPFDWSY